MEIVFIGNPFGNADLDVSASCTSKECGTHTCSNVYSCKKKYTCGTDKCKIDTESYDDEYDEYWD